MRLLIVLTVFLFIPAAGVSNTYYVPDHFSSIQEAIDASSHGDTIIVRGGTYMENIDFLGKAITVKSEDGPASTIIDGDEKGSVVTFQTGEGVGSVLKGFTISNGVGTPIPYMSGAGGGIYCVNSSPTIMGNLIFENAAHSGYQGWAYGGGIYCASSSPVIINNLICENLAQGSLDGYGGGIYCTESSPTITNNTITRNIAKGGEGGGICCYECTPVITNTILWNNVAGPLTSELEFGYGSSTVVTYCDVKGGTGQSWFGKGCIDSNPYFLAPMDDFHIVNFSPCRNAGTNNAPGVPGTDFEGDDRILEGTVDMGADEFSTPHGTSGTYYVPGNYFSIQEAIDSAFPLDTIIVAPDTYYENIHFLGKAITVKSSGWPELTIIDGGKMGHVVAFTSTDPANSRLEGFTITNGAYGIDCSYYYSSPTISNNIITGNARGIHCEHSSPVIVDNIISYNTVNGSGAGINCFYMASPNITNNTITFNTADASVNNGGGGICCESTCQPVITGNTITNNSSNNGGGIWLDHYSLVDEDSITDNYIADNSATKFGGGIYCHIVSNIKGNIICNNSAMYGGGIYRGAAITNNLILDNYASFDGGGICGFMTCTNNVISGNSASGSGGGINCMSNSSSPNINNNTIAGNSAGESGGGVCCDLNTEVTVVNSILWQNSAPVGPEIWTGGGSTFTLSYSDVKGGKASVYVESGSILIWGQDMIDVDPLFVNPENNDFHLKRISPCINRGTNNDSPADDIDGDPRPCLGTADMGADEFSKVHLLEVDIFSVSGYTGGAVNFSLNGSIINGGRDYILLGGVTGTVPGIPLPGGVETLRLNWDPFTDLVISIINTSLFMNFLGTFDVSGTAMAQLNVPPDSGFVGITMYYAYALNNPWDLVSNPVAIEIVP